MESEENEHIRCYEPFSSKKLNSNSVINPSSMIRSKATPHNRNPNNPAVDLLSPDKS